MREPLRLEAPEREKSESYLLCLLEGILLGIEALAVRELLPLPWITPVREAPPLVAGVVNVRGALIPVVDLSAALGLAPHRAQTNDVLVLLQRAGSPVGIVVSEVRDVCPLRNGAVARPDLAAPALHGGTALVESLLPLGDEVAQLLRLDTILKWGAASDLESFEVARPDAATLSFFASSSPEQLELFRSRARSLSQNFETTLDIEARQMRPLAAFAMDGEYFGLDLSVVREFSLLRTVTPVPWCPPHIIGLMNLRGETLTLVDISMALGLAPVAVKNATSRVVVVQCEGLRLGIVVDEVLDIVSINTGEMMQSAPSASKGDEAALGVVRGTLFFREKMLGVLDMPRLLQSEALAV